MLILKGNDHEQTWERGPTTDSWESYLNFSVAAIAYTYLEHHHSPYVMVGQQLLFEGFVCLKQTGFCCLTAWLFFFFL